MAANMADICKHFRVRDFNMMGCDPDDVIKFIEKQFHEDITLTHPQWKELVKRLHVTSTDVNRRIKECKARKALIAHKLFIESARFTPFEQSEVYARTRKKWTKIELSSKARKKIRKIQSPEITVIPEKSISKVNVEEESESVHDISFLLQKSKETDTKEEATIKNDNLNTFLSRNFPPFICTNPRSKLPSIIKSEDVSQLRSHSIASILSQESQLSSEHDPWMLKETTLVHAPHIVRITHDSLLEQTLHIPVRNVSAHIKYIRYVDVESHQCFRYAKVVPLIPQKLYPQLPVILKFVFKLKEYKMMFETKLRFKVGHSGTPDEALFVLVSTDFIRARNVFVPPIVRLPPLYAWHFKKDNKYPKTIMTVIVDDDFDYHLHIRKRNGDVIKTQKDVSKTSLSEDDDDFENTTTTQFTLSPKVIDVKMSVNFLFRSIAEEIVERSLDKFIFKRSYVSLLKNNDANRKRIVKLPIYFMKVENSGCHNAYFDFLFITPKTGDVIISKTCRVFADILPHPLVIDPPFMLVETSHDRVYHGYGETSFSITNTNNVHPAYVKISTTKKTHNLFRIIPMKATIESNSKVTFEVKFCTVDRLRLEKDFVYCKIKIYVSGYAPIYKNAPPIEYELIGPFAIYYKHLSEYPAIVYIDRT